MYMRRWTLKAGMQSQAVSFATPQVSGIAARAIQFIREGLAISSSTPEWRHRIESNFGGKVCPIVPSPDLIKRMIEHMAIEMPG